MKQTTQFGLNQWEQTDRILMEDFNRDNAKVEAALAEVSASAAASAATLAQHTAAIAKLGNCQIYTTSYTGTAKNGAANPTVLYFPKRPMLVFIFGGGRWFMGHPDSGIAYSQNSGGNAAACAISRSGNQISLHSEADPDKQMNGYGKTYSVLALLDAAQ